jgi:hypothetical protein
MDAQEFSKLLQGLLTAVVEGDSNEIESIACDLNDFICTGHVEIRSFQDAGLMTRDEGIVINTNGSMALQITILDVGGFDPDDDA